VGVEADQRNDVGSAVTYPQTVRPHLALRIAAPAAYAGFLVLLLTGDSIHDLWDALSTAFFAVLTGIVAGMAIRERLVIEGDEVHIVRLFTGNVVALTDVVAMVQSGGRGRPRHLALRDGVTASVRGIDLTQWPPRSRFEAVGLRVPGLMTSRQVARALQIPLTNHRGGPVAGWAVSAADALTPSGHLRPFFWVIGAVFAVLVGLVVSMILYWPGS
jgi:hypothetical protein